MDEQDVRLALVERFFRGTGTMYDFMVAAATLGIDRLWKRAIVARLPPDPGRVLDLACGTGISTLAIAQRYARCQVVGVELREEYLALARAKIARLGVTNIEFVLARAENYRSPEPFDCITSSYLAKYADLDALVRASRDQLKDGGVFLVHDFTLPPKRHLVVLWRVYFFLLQRIGGALFPAWREIYHGLPGLIERTRWLPELVAALERYGFTGIRTDYLTLYGSAIVMAKKGSA